MYGMSFDKPAVHMREYLSILLPCIRDQRVNVTASTLTAAGSCRCRARRRSPC